MNKSRLNIVLAIVVLLFHLPAFAAADDPEATFVSFMEMVQL
jgi:hypothetical protein